MRILVDGVAFENGYQRGVQRYFRELITRVARTYAVDLFLSSPAKAELPLNCPLTFRKERFGAHPRNVPLRAWRKLKRRVAPTRFSGHTLFHSTFFTRSPEPGLPELVTVYDMIPERFEAEFPEWGQTHIQTKRLCMEAANRIVCISHSTSADVAEIYPHLASKLCVVHLGADHLLAGRMDEPAAESCNDRSTGISYLLQIGDRHTYKNFGVLLRALSEPNWPADIRLKVAGPPPTVAELEAVKKAGLESRVEFTGPVSDVVLKGLFRNAAGFVFPSLYEGFGFPLLEAQSLGTPVICSDIPVFRETAGNSTLFFDPRNPASLAAAAAELLGGKAAALSAAGLENVRRFRWEECARLTTEIYRSIGHEVSSS